MSVTWEPRTREQRNALLTHKDWRIARLDKAGRALVVPVGDNGRPLLGDRVWIEPDQIVAGGLAARLGSGRG